MLIETSIETERRVLHIFVSDSYSLWFRMVLFLVCGKKIPIFFDFDLGTTLNIVCGLETRIRITPLTGARSCAYQSLTHCTDNRSIVDHPYEITLQRTYNIEKGRLERSYPCARLVFVYCMRQIKYKSKGFTKRDIDSNN